MQIVVKYAVTEEAALRGVDGAITRHITSHQPIWVFNKQFDGRSSDPRNQFGSWRLSARLRDETVTGGKGPEVDAQQPPPKHVEKLTEGWELQKAAMKAEPYTIAGFVNRLCLR